MANCLTFDGSTGFITSPTSTVFRTPSTAIFLGAWVTWAAYPQGTAFAMPAVLNYGASAQSYGFLADGSGSNLFFNLQLTTNGNHGPGTSGFTPTVGNWYWIVGTWSSGGAIRVSVYDNNLSQVASTSSSNFTDTIAYSGDYFSMGSFASSGPTGANWWNGSIGAVVLSSSSSSGSTDDTAYAKCIAANFPHSPLFFTGLCSTGNITDLSGNGSVLTSHGTVTNGSSTPPYTPCVVTLLTATTESYNRESLLIYGSNLR